MTLRRHPYLTALMLALATAAHVPAQAQTADDRRVPRTRAEMTLSFAPLVRQAAPAVVNVYTRRVVEARRRSPLFDDPFFRRFFGDGFPAPGGTQKRVQNSLGSGVIVRADGLIVTNQHVVEKADEITVVLADRREFDAEVVLRDEQTDLAILKIDTAGEELPFLPFRDSDTLEVGDIVLAIGNPFGVGQTVTSGIVSAVARTAQGVSDYGFFIQTDAAINPGNSGGALVSMDGRLAGINTAIYSRGGGSNGIGFAIPANMVATVVASADKGDRVRRPWLGARGQTVTADVAAGLKLPRPFGVLISSVAPNGPAARAGLKVGDIVVSVGGREVPDANSLRFRLGTLRLGDTADLTVLRNGGRTSLALRLEAAPEDPPRNVTNIGGRNPVAGAEVANRSPALVEELQIPTDERGVIILRIRRGSPADRVGLEPGDILLGLNDEKTGRVADLQRMLGGVSEGWRMVVRRKGRLLQMNIRG
jgi:Do/DeqQ family serine protease